MMHHFKVTIQNSVSDTTTETYSLATVLLLDSTSKVYFLQEGRW